MPLQLQRLSASLVRLAPLTELDRDAAAVVIPPVRRHGAFIVDFRPETLVGQIVDDGNMAQKSAVAATNANFSN